jgi:glycine/D-amino acid oxidase-like deaminating enzyme
VNDFATRSFWLGRHPYEPSAPLREAIRADVVIVGGGFTGLWTAIQVKQTDPAADVVVLERDVIGYGASGRNGGFAMTMVGRNISELARKCGDEAARAQHLAMVQSLGELEDFARREGIAADIERRGLLTVSNGPEQDVRIRNDVECAERLGLGSFHYLDAKACQELVRSERLRCGHFEDHSLLVDPAALARGLKEAALRRGVRIFEHTACDFVGEEGGQVVVRAETGSVTAARGLLATNAYAHAIPSLRRYIFTIYAYITLTEPLTDEQWGRVGWERRMGIEDKRVMPHFHRPTADGRILWGGRDAPFMATGPDARHDRNDYIFGRLEETFRWTFPQLADVRIDHGWAGPVCGTVHCISTIGALGSERLFYALGYAGHGVGPSHLMGKIARDFLLDRKTAERELPMATKKPQWLPPGFLRAAVLGTALRALQRADDTAGKGALSRLALRFLQ